MDKQHIPSEQKAKISHEWKSVKKDYKIIEFVGAGAQGQVLKAKHRATGRLVAIKYIKKAFKNIHSAKRTLREINILKKLTE